MEEGCWRLRRGSRDGDLAGSAAKAAFYDECSFEEDPAVPGYPWPPRSYSCSFCRREFRSAQALGGHVNVHRRDRARMKLSASTQIEIGIRQIPRNPVVSAATPRSLVSPSFRASQASSAENAKGQTFVTPPYCSAFLTASPDQSSLQIPAAGDLLVKAPGSKRRKRDMIFPLALRFSANDESLLQSEALPPASVPVEEIDLELRLGGSALV